MALSALALIAATWLLVGLVFAVLFGRAVGMLVARFRHF